MSVLEALENKLIFGSLFASLGTWLGIKMEWLSNNAESFTLLIAFVVGIGGLLIKIIVAYIDYNYKKHMREIARQTKNCDKNQVIQPVRDVK